VKIVICTDSWHPKVCGVVRTLQTTIANLQNMGHQVIVIEPNLFRNIPCPFYPELKMAFPSFSSIRKVLPQQFDAIHIATECSLGLQMSRYCVAHKIPFTTSYTTNVAEQAAENAFIPRALSQRYIRWFHKRSKRVFVSTVTLRKKFWAWGLPHNALWTRGVNDQLFSPRKMQKPEERILLYSGRVAKEKNLEAFLSSKIPGKKMVVGDGPMRKQLERKYPEAHFLGYLTGEKLAEAYSLADVFVFPSKTDTFGLVMLEALACGVPVAAYPVEGPQDIITDPRLGCLSENLNEAIETALNRGDKSFCREYAQTYSWENSTKQFLANLCRL
jgi:glycosyltransferase involved in cell wall biosynthesis